MRRVAVVLLVLAACAGGVYALSEVDRPWVQALGAAVVLGGTAAIFAFSRTARSGISDRYPGVGAVASGLYGLERRIVLLTLAVAVTGFVAGEALERLLAPPGDLESHIASTYRSLGETRTPSGGTARTYAATVPPLAAAATLDRAFPAEDQRYTPVGVFLRYEDHIVGLLPDGGRTRLFLESDDDGFAHFGHYVGDFWGPRYDDEAGVVESAKAVPDRRDAERLVEHLRQAEEVHDVCYGWDVVIRSGRMKGRTQGSSNRGAGRRIERTDCRDWVQLDGWIDPLANRFSRRDEPGEWSLGMSYTLDATIDLPGEALGLLSVPENEMIRGATQEPTDDGERAGKGLIEYVGSLPLIVEQAAGLPSVPVVHRRPEGALAPVERSDAERRADAGWRGGPPALLRVVGGFAVFAFVLLVPAGLVRRLVRRLRA